MEVQRNRAGGGGAATSNEALGELDWNTDQQANVDPQLFDIPVERDLLMDVRDQSPVSSEYIGSLLRQLLNNPSSVTDKATQQKEPLTREDPLAFFTSESLENNFFPISSEQPTRLEVPPLPESARLVERPRQQMKCFPADKVQDFKHLLYNLLVENHNRPDVNTLVQPFTIVEGTEVRTGFRFNPLDNPEKRLPELYAQHIKKARLDLEDQSSVFIQDLYKFYMRACVELLSKYFCKRDKYTYLYDDVLLFIPNETLEQAEKRLVSMKSRSRKKRKMSLTD